MIKKHLTLLDVADMFRDEDMSRAWLSAQRWPEGPRCPRCGSENVGGVRHKSMTHRCRDCEGRPMFSLKSGTLMEGSKLGYRIWAIGIYLLTTNIKGISSMALHRELGIGQKAAWFMLHRLRMAYETEAGRFNGPVEVDETYMGGKRRNMHFAVRKTLSGRGSVGKTPVIGALDRSTNTIEARVLRYTDRETLHEFIEDVVQPGAMVYTDEASAYNRMPFPHEAVTHSAGEYVRGPVHTNGIESFWSMLKRAHKGTYHKMSPKHLQRYVTEFTGRHNAKNLGTLSQMKNIAEGMAGKRLTYRELVA